jgi:putative glutamine amidotransferase
MARPRIGLVTYGRDADNWFSVPAQYVDSIRRAGGQPVLLPPSEPDLPGWFEIVDGLVLPGGGDIDPHSYGGSLHRENYKLDRARDADELAMVHHIVTAQLPTLAICRGMQVVNVALGGSLIAHVPDAVGERVLHRSAERRPIAHRVAVAADSGLAAVMQATEVTVASWHHQAVDRVAAPFRAVAHTADGLIEAMEQPGHRWLLCVQWHPELTAADDPTQQRLFDALVSAASGRRSPR